MSAPDYGGVGQNDADKVRHSASQAEKNQAKSRQQISQDPATRVVSPGSSTITTPITPGISATKTATANNVRGSSSVHKIVHSLSLNSQFSSFRGGGC